MANITHGEMAKVLISLVQADMEAVSAYGQALKEMEAAGLRDQLKRFQNAHGRHVDQLSAVIRALDAEPPDKSPEHKSRTEGGLTPIRPGCGAEEALRTMKSNEELTRRRYREAFEMELTPNIKELVGRYLEDERMHLRFIEQALANRMWENESVDPPR